MRCETTVRLVFQTFSEDSRLIGACSGYAYVVPYRSFGSSFSQSEMILCIGAGVCQLVEKHLASAHGAERL
jgi:hypothetical protein